MLIPIAYLVDSACILVSAFRFDSCRPMGNDLVHGAIADDLPHDGFGNCGESPGFPNVEKEFDRIGDAVLNHPFHQYGVQVTRHHLRFAFPVARNLKRIGGARGRKPEFLLQTAVLRE